MVKKRKATEKPDTLLVTGLSTSYEMEMGLEMRGNNFSLSNKLTNWEVSTSFFTSLSRKEKKRNQLFKLKLIYVWVQTIWEFT